MRAQLSQLILSNIRNLNSVNLNFGAKFNLFVGPNGSGKTSLLEAMYLLSVGRSFRARSMQQVISFDAEQCLIRAKIQPYSDQYGTDVWVGVSRSKSGDVQYRIGEQNDSKAAELSRLLPIQLIDVNSPLLLEGGPKNRRQFIDWGVFHVEQSFLEHWRLMQRALEQRNAGLKQKKTPAAEWDATFIKYALLVDAARAEYIHAFSAVFVPMLQEMLSLGVVELKYQRGWSSDYDLATALQRTTRMDAAFGYTNCGPHRADLDVLLDGKPAKAVLSRGQTKIFVCTMLLARAKLLEQQRNCVFLIDDLHAELDQHNCNLLIKELAKLNCQVFITGIEAEWLQNRLRGFEQQLFHVEQGCISQRDLELASS